MIIIIIIIIKKPQRSQRRDSRKTLGWGGGQATPVSGLFQDGHLGGADGQTAERERDLILLRCHCASQRQSPLLSGYRNDAELCLLLTSPMG